MLEKSGGAERPSVCIVTSELVGPYNNGGIGTSMTGLAQWLAAAGFPVTLLYTGGKFSSPRERDQWCARYRDIHIQLDWLPHDAAAGLTGPVAACGFAAPYLVYLYLRDRSFDVVQFNDCMGEGFYCLAMKRIGAAFRGTAFFVGLHSPSQWIFEINRTLPDKLLFAAFNHAERLSVRAADLLWSPSRYLLDWTRARGFAHAPATIVQKYVLPSPALFGPAPASRREEPEPPRTPVRPREIVFFGRLEERKGLRLFCSALPLIGDLLVERDITITFLGKPGTVGDRPALEIIEEQSRDWRWSWRVIADLGQQEAVDHLRSGEALAVIASPADNSPCTVYEALAYGIPFLAARTGGITELLHEEDRKSALFDPDPGALARTLAAALSDGIAPARPMERQQETRRRWIDSFERWRDFLSPPVAEEPERRLRVLVDGIADADLHLTLASLDLPEVDEVIVVDRGGHGSAALPAAVRTVAPDQPGALLAALGGDAADAVLMMRAGTMLAPQGAKALVEALRAGGVDGIIPAARHGAGADRRVLPPLGGCPSFCLFEGAAPGGAMLVKAERLAEAVASRRLPPDVEYLGLADLAVARGLEIWPFAEPLIDHPGDFVRDRRSRRAPERIAAYAAADPTEAFYATAIGYGGFAPDAGVAGVARAVRDRLVTMRLGWVAGTLRKVVPRRVAERLRRRRS